MLKSKEMTANKIKIKENPYKFLDYYTEDDKDFFFGRRREAEILFNDITTTRLVVLFAKTGTGKTSLINAGVIPRLREFNYKPLYIRVEKDPIESIRKYLRDDDEKTLLPQEFEGKSLALQLEKAVDLMQKPIVLFMDQFEEFFIYILNKDQKKAHQFITNIAKVYRNRQSGVHFVFSMREEFFVEMDVFRDEIPYIFHHDSNLRLRCFDKEQAREAIVGPAQKLNVEFEEALLKQLLNDLIVDNTIEPARLQIVCDTLWKRKSNGQIKYDDYKQLGNVKLILDQRLEEDINKYLKNIKELQLFEAILPKLSTEHGTKNILGVDILKEDLKEDNIDESSLNNLIDHLKNLHLIRETTYYGAIYIEWTSDYLAEQTDYLFKRVKTILLRRKLKAGFEKCKNKKHELIKQIGQIKTTFIIPATKDALDALYMKYDDFENNFNEDAALLLDKIEKHEAEFLLAAALEHGLFMTSWFQKALECNGDVWKILNDRIEYGDPDNIQFENTIQLLCEIRSKQAIELLKVALKQENLVSKVIKILRITANKETIDILAMTLEQEGPFALRAGIALNTIANSRSDKAASLAREVLENISKKKATSLFLLALAKEFEIDFWFEKVVESGSAFWNILKNNLTKIDPVMQSEKTINLLYDFSTLEAIEFWDVLLKKEKFIDQAILALKRMSESSTCAADIRERAKNILDDWKKDNVQTINQTQTYPTYEKKRISSGSGLYGMREDDWDLFLSRIAQGKCTPFLGAGACWPYLPLSSQISQDLAKKYNYPLPDIDNLPRVAQFLAIERRDAIFPKEIVIDILRAKKIPDFTSYDIPHSVLAELPLPIYLTTNYDDFMFQALRQRRKKVEREYCRWNRYVSKEPSLLKRDFVPTVQNPLVYYLYGMWDIAESLVLTEDDYIDFLVNVSENIHHSLHHRVRRSLTGTSLLFIGYRLEDLSFRTIFRGLINVPEKSLRRTCISVQTPPKDEYLGSIKNSIKILEKFIYGLDINDTESKSKILQSIDKLKKITDKIDISKEDKDLLYPEINFLESQLYQRQMKNSEKKYFVNIINLLQESLGLLPTVDEQKSQEDALKFLEEYYKEMDIRIYWGNAQQFVKELRERWEYFQRSNARNDH